MAGCGAAPWRERNFAISVDAIETARYIHVMSSEDYRGTVMYDGPCGTITRMMPGFEVTLRGEARRQAEDTRRGYADRRFGSKRDAIAWMLEMRTVAREAPAAKPISRVAA